MRRDLIVLAAAVAALTVVAAWAASAKPPGFVPAVSPAGCAGGADAPAEDPFAGLGSQPLVVEATRHDVSPPLRSLEPPEGLAEGSACGEEGEEERAGPALAPADDEDGEAIAASALEDGVQTADGTRPAPKQVANFDGVGFGFVGPTNQPQYVTPSDNNAAPGPEHVFEMANVAFAIFDKQGTPLYGPVRNNTIFAGFGGQCQVRNSGDPVVRFDQLAQRWVVIMPVFQAPWFLCFAISKTADPLGEYYRYAYPMPRFPDYPRLGVWPDAYYVTVSSGDNGDERVTCAHDRAKMLVGEAASQQCFVLRGQFVVPADLEGQELPPPGAPNLQMATGGAQLLGDLDDDGIYFWKFHVDWDDPARSTLTPKAKIPVDEYSFLCGGQLVSCVPQPGTTRRLDSQGDKLMYRLAYRNFGTHESLVATHSVNVPTAGGGVRWYEFRLDADGDPFVHQQSTYAPDGNYRWMGSITMDRQGNTAVGYSYGGAGIFPGIRFASRQADDPANEMGFQEGVILEGTGSQTNSLRWDDYTSMQIDPVDDCTFWYTNNYVKVTGTGTRWSTRLGAFRLPDCLRGTVAGTTYFDLDHDGELDPAEPGLAGWDVHYAGDDSGTIATGADGTYSRELRADELYLDPTYVLSQPAPGDPAWTPTGPRSYTVELEDREVVSGLDFGNVCTVRASGGAGLGDWASRGGENVLRANDPAWRQLVGERLHLVRADGSRFTVSGSFATAYGQLRAWLLGANSTNASYMASAQLLSAAFSAAFGAQDGGAHVEDPVAGGWLSLDDLVERVGGVGGLIEARPDTTSGPGRESVLRYKDVFDALNNDAIAVTPSAPSGCPPPR